MAKKKKKEKLSVDCLSLDYYSGIYCLINGEYQMFYSSTQAYLYFQTASKKARRKILSDINVMQVKHAALDSRLKTEWDYKAQRLALVEIFKAKFSQNSRLGKFLLKLTDEDINSYTHKSCSDLEPDIIRAALLTTWKKLKKLKQQHSLSRVPYYSARLED